MKLTIKLFAYFSKLLPPHAENQAINVEADDDANVGQVLEMLGVPLAECRLIIINGITHTNPVVSLKMKLQPGDTVAALPNIH